MTEIIAGTRDDMLKQIDTFKAFQVKNCQDCFFAIAEKVGTSLPCCTYPGKLDHRNSDGKRPTGDDEIVCYSKRPGEPRG